MTIEVIENDTEIEPELEPEVPIWSISTAAVAPAEVGTSFSLLSQKHLIDETVNRIKDLSRDIFRNTRIEPLGVSVVPTGRLHPQALRDALPSSIPIESFDLPYVISLGDSLKAIWRDGLRTRVAASHFGFYLLSTHTDEEQAASINASLACAKDLPRTVLRTDSEMWSPDSNFGTDLIYKIESQGLYGITDVFVEISGCHNVTEYINLVMQLNNEYRGNINFGFAFDGPHLASISLAENKIADYSDDVLGNEVRRLFDLLVEEPATAELLGMVELSQTSHGTFHLPAHEGPIDYPGISRYWGKSRAVLKKHGVDQIFPQVHYVLDHNPMYNPSKLRGTNFCSYLGLVDLEYAFGWRDIYNPF